MIWFISSLIIMMIAIYIYWRFFWFFRDPHRVIPTGKTIVSPADGTIVYVKKVKHDTIPIAIKKGRKLHLEEIAEVHDKNFTHDHWLIGIFMTPLDVHVNRAPLEGIVKKLHYFHSKNVPMTLMWLKVLFHSPRAYVGSKHIVQNERNTIKIINGRFYVYVVQIADIYVRKIVNWVKKGQHIQKGQRIGMIKMGSQVDLIFPAHKNVKVLVKKGQHTIAGETILGKW